MVVIDDKQPASFATEGSLPSSGLVKRMVHSISNQILNKQQIDEIRLKQQTQTKQTNTNLTMLTSKSVVSDLKKAIESNLNTTKSATDDKPIGLHNNKNLITKLSANFIHENHNNTTASNCSTNSTNLNSNKKLTKYNTIRPYQLQETVDGIQIQIKQPHLITVIFKETNEFKQENLKTSIRIYPLKSGRTTIGSALTNDIIVNGPGIEEEHCIIENILIDSHSKSKATKSNLVTIYPLAHLCSVDGVLVDNPFKLSSGLYF